MFVTLASFFYYLRGYPRGGGPAGVERERGRVLVLQVAPVMLLLLVLLLWAGRVVVRVVVWLLLLVVVALQIDILLCALSDENFQVFSYLV